MGQHNVAGKRSRGVSMWATPRLSEEVRSRIDTMQYDSNPVGKVEQTPSALSRSVGPGVPRTFVDVSGGGATVRVCEQGPPGPNTRDSWR